MNPSPTTSQLCALGSLLLQEDSGRQVRSPPPTVACRGLLSVLRPPTYRLGVRGRAFSQAKGAARA